MSKKLIRSIAIAIAVLASAINATATEPITLTRHAYGEGNHNLFRTLFNSSDAVFAILNEDETSSDETNTTEFILLSELQEPIHKFSITHPKTHGYDTLFIATTYSGLSSDNEYWSEILVTQHLFNDDDLYEVVLSYYDYNEEEKHLAVYNEKGEYLGEVPSRKLYCGEKETFIGAGEDSAGGFTALYSINKRGNGVSELISATPRLRVNPNPTKDEETVTVMLPEASISDITIQIFSLGGSLLVSKECKERDTTVEIPAYRLSTGVNLVVAVDAEGNVVYTGKIIKE